MLGGVFCGDFLKCAVVFLLINTPFSIPNPYTVTYKKCQLVKPVPYTLTFIVSIKWSNQLFDMLLCREILVDFY